MTARPAMGAVAGIATFVSAQANETDRLRHAVVAVVAVVAVAVVLCCGAAYGSARGPWGVLAE